MPMTASILDAEKVRIEKYKPRIINVDNKYNNNTLTFTDLHLQNSESVRNETFSNAIRLLRKTRQNRRPCESDDETRITCSASRMTWDSCWIPAGEQSPPLCHATSTASAVSGNAPHTDEVDCRACTSTQHFNETANNISRNNKLFHRSTLSV